MKRSLAHCIFAALLALSAPAAAVDLGVEFTRRLNDGIAAYEAGEFEKAQLSFQEALLLRPQSAEARMNLGLASARLAQRDKAAGAFREVAEMSAEQRARLAQAWYNRGRNQLDLAGELATGEEPKLDEALAAAINGLEQFQRALDVQPDYMDAQYNQAQSRHLIEQIAQKQLQQQQQQQSQNQQDKPQQGDENQQDQQEQQNQQNEDQQNQDQQPQSGNQQQEQPNDQQKQDEENQQSPQSSSDSSENENREEQPQQSEGEAGEENEKQELPQEEQAPRPQDGEQKEGTMTEQEARNLLNMLGNVDFVRFRKESRVPPGSRKEW